MSSAASIEKLAQVKEVPIGRIWQDLQAYKDQRVTVSGKYRGWQDKDIQHPMITRSDWVIRDHTGGIYVSGKHPGLDPITDLGSTLTVTGVVKISKKGIPYLHGEVVSIDLPSQS